MINNPLLFTFPKIESIKKKTVHHASSYLIGFLLGYFSICGLVY